MAGSRGLTFPLGQCCIVESVSMNQRLTIKEAADKFGMTPKAIRYYERIGIIHKPERTLSGYRIYSPDDLKRLAFIAQAKSLGFTLKEIKQILIIRTTGKDPCGHYHQLFKLHREEISKKIENLIKFRDDLERYYHSLKIIPGQTEGCDICESSNDQNKERR